MAAASRAQGNGMFPAGWGIDNEYLTLRDVLLGKPDHFGWRPISAIARRTFANMAKLGIRFDLQTAVAQHREMVDIYVANGVATHFLEADEGLPCSVYARDSSAMTPWGALVASIQTPYRRRDYAVVSAFYHRHGIPIWRWVTAGHFEGGDFDIIEPGAVMLGYNNERSEEAGALQVAGWVEEEGWEALVVPIPAHFVHMDALVVAIAPKMVVACTDALEDHVVAWIKARRIEIVDVPYRDCIRLGCNVVGLGQDRILSMASNTRLNERLKALGFTVFAPDVSQFQHGGGGVHCMSQALRRDRATPGA
jgi:N-dimethylarginine dimethylaminohydrolase